MVERLSERTVATESVQGEGSWIRVRSLTVGEVLGIRQEAEQRTRWTYKLGRIVGWFRRLGRRESAVDRAEQAHLRTVAKVTAWNWKDADGNDLPQPHEDRGIVFQLSEDELIAIYDAVYQRTQGEETKN